jgi:hypothetical protein
MVDLLSFTRILGNILAVYFHIRAIKILYSSKYISIHIIALHQVPNSPNIFTKLYRLTNKICKNISLVYFQDS